MLETLLRSSINQRGLILILVAMLAGLGVWNYSRLPSDAVPDIKAAHAAGAWSIGVLTGAGDSALLSAAGAHRLVAGRGRGYRRG